MKTTNLIPLAMIAVFTAVLIAIPSPAQADRDYYRGRHIQNHHGSHYYHDYSYRSRHAYRHALRNRHYHSHRYYSPYYRHYRPYYGPGIHISPGFGIYLRLN